VTQKLRCSVERLAPHGGGVYTVWLRPERPAPRFRPGQFLHLALDAYDPSGFWPDSRAFSIASAPGERERIRLTYAVHGRFTTRMEAELAEGREVWIKMPHGDFVIDGRDDVALFAGGTGITAFTAFLDGPACADRRVAVAYGARTNDLLIYRDVVDRAAERSSSLDVLYFVEAQRAGDRAGTLPGRVSVAAVWPRLRDPFDTHYYISGPPAMLRGIGDDLRARGVGREAIHIDAWE
jgi:ferredoxin-NADP reductase